VDVQPNARLGEMGDLIISFTPHKGAGPLPGDTLLLSLFLIIIIRTANGILPSGSGTKIRLN
jgi:hypothetical protein